MQRKIIQNQQRKTASHFSVTVAGRQRAKVCPFCAQGAPLIDYKNAKLLRPYMSSYAKIQPRYYTGVCLHHQKKLAQSIKRTRHMAILSFVR